MKRMLLTLGLIAFLITGCATPTRDAALVEKGFQQIQKNDMAAAEASFDEALKANPDNAYAMVNLGYIYQSSNRTAKAVEMYNKVIKRNGPEMVEKSDKEGKAGKTLVQLAKENLALIK